MALWVGERELEDETASFLRLAVDLVEGAYYFIGGLFEPKMLW